jgi:type VI secretion system protein ImpE
VEAERLYKEGKLGEAIASLQEELRSDPHDVPRRIFLFELLLFQGEFERARKQLDVVEMADPESYIGTAYQKHILTAEERRQEMFRKGTVPDRMEDDENLSGTLNGEAFEYLSDSDPRIGPRLEMIAGGQYVWMPFSEISQIRISPPKLLRDLYWASAEIVTRDQPDDADAKEVLLPAMTALSWQNENEGVRLGRVTEWHETESGDQIPAGQKILFVDDEDVPILEVRELIIDHS